MEIKEHKIFSHLMVNRINVKKKIKKYYEDDDVIEWYTIINTRINLNTIALKNIF